MAHRTTNATTATSNLEKEMDALLQEEDLESLVLSTKSLIAATKSGVNISNTTARNLAGKLATCFPPDLALRRSVVDGNIGGNIHNIPSANVDGPTSNKPMCHGRVAELDTMVPSQWWTTVFGDAMYLKTDGDVVEDPEVTRAEINVLQRDAEIKKIFMKGSDEDGRSDAPAKILDLCCGQGRHTLLLAKEYPHLQLHGHDQSSYLISLGQERASFSSLTSNTTFTVGDCRQIPYPDETFDLVMVMGNSFGYFADEDSDRTVLSEIARVLMPGGRMVLDITDGGYMRQNFSERSWEWIDDQTFVCRERQLSKGGLRLTSREVITSVDRGVIRDQFYSERLYSREDLEQMMNAIGLEVGKDETSTDEKGAGDDELSSSCVLTAAMEFSKRKEDLGMMGCRMIVTGVKPGAPTTAVVVEPTNIATPSVMSLLKTPKFTPIFTHMTVVMGDPSQSCFGKLNNTWNAEDMLTRQRLYDALFELGYAKDQIKILEHHSSLYQNLETLKKARPDTIIFNLCDEGFDNDALKELHVPALLEILRLPYTGAGPNCLAFCYDKGLVNRTADAMGVATPSEALFLSDVATPAVSDIDRLHTVVSERIGYPAFIKPMKGDNSLGITGRSIVHSASELATYMKELQGIGIRDVVVQEYLQGTEYGVGMIGNLASGFHFLPILEVDYSKILNRNLPPILGFESKWDPNSPYWSEISYKKATISPEVEKTLKASCIALWERFGCRDYARFDFRADKGRGDGFDGLGGTIKLLEVNPNPGWCWDGKFAYMGKLEGKDYKDVLGMILAAAAERFKAEMHVK
ncbi:hypothetical protein HDU76_004520 [Blyttiomyces sp. JEL0837]|nr:hypothetical protein HDU76_004520 [Blyttiomyces sp. JEL0837]